MVSVDAKHHVYLLTYFATAQQLLSQLLCGTVTKTKSEAPLLGNNWCKRSPTFKPSSTSLLLIILGSLAGPAPPPSSWSRPDPQKRLTSLWESSSPPSSWSRLDSVTVMMMMMSWCLMSSDVIWHIRDKLWPMPKHGSIKSTYVRCMRV